MKEKQLSRGASAQKTIYQIKTGGKIFLKAKTPHGVECFR